VYDPFTVQREERKKKKGRDLLFSICCARNAGPIERRREGEKGRKGKRIAFFS